MIVLSKSRPNLSAPGTAGRGSHSGSSGAHHLDDSTRKKGTALAPDLGAPATEPIASRFREFPGNAMSASQAGAWGMANFFAELKRRRPAGAADFVCD